MVELAKSEQPIPLGHESLDRDPWLLNCENGTIDLQSGELRPHRREDFLSMTTGVEYPEAIVSCPVWISFLETIFDDDRKLIDFTQRLLGYALVGEVKEHILPILHGCGANGKSTLVETALAALGEYGLKAPHGFGMVKRNGEESTAIADLVGKRMVLVSETQSGKRLSESFVKEISGGDTLRARHLFKNYFSFTPSHLCLMVTNHRPTVEGTDLGIWRRLRLIPFDVTIPEAKQDHDLPQKLRAELPAILQWMVVGCLTWQRDGLRPPERVLAATAGYRSESDSFLGWWNDCVIVEPSAEVRAVDAADSYFRWCNDNGDRSTSQKAFGQRIRSMDGVDVRRSNGIIYVGIGINKPDPIKEFTSS